MTDEDKFENFIDEGLRRGAAQGYHPTVFIGMREKWGTVGAVRRLVVSGDIQSGFRRLVSLGLGDWTVEAGVITLSNLFGKDVVQAARFRLEQAAEHGSK